MQIKIIYVWCGTINLFKKNLQNNRKKCGEVTNEKCVDNKRRLVLIGAQLAR